METLICSDIFMYIKNFITNVIHATDDTFSHFGNIINHRSKVSRKTLSQNIKHTNSYYIRIYVSHRVLLRVEIPPL